MRHIEKVTGAVFLLDGGGTAPDKPYNDSTEPPYLLVK